MVLATSDTTIIHSKIFIILNTILGKFTVIMLPATNNIGITIISDIIPTIDCFLCAS